MLLPLAACVLAANGSLCYGQTDGNALGAAEKAYVLSRFCTEVKYNFAYYNKLAFDFDSLCMASLPSLAATSSDDDFLKAMQALCARLDDGHTYIYAANTPGKQDEWVRPFPMETKRIGGRVFVTRVYSSFLEAQGVCEKCEILEIDGEKVLDYGNRHVRPYLSSSTPQWADYAPFGSFELTKDKGTKVSRITFRSPGEKVFTVESSRNLSWDMQESRQAIRFRTLGGNIGLLSVSSFQDFDFSRTYFDKLWGGILETDALVIDIRDNWGGNSSHADYLMSHFSNRPVRLGAWDSPMYIAAHASWHYPPERYMQTPVPLRPASGKEIYLKPVVLLVNATTFSSAENFCVAFKGARRGKIIGTPTGGSTGNPISIDLGYGIGCCICTKHELDADGNEFVGVGIRPDIVVEEDADLFVQGRDNVVEKAVEYLKTQMK